MADEPNGRPTWPHINALRAELSRERDKLEERMQKQIDGLRGDLRREVDSAKTAAKAASEASERVFKWLTRVAYTFGGGAGLVAFAAWLWAYIIQPLWILLRSAS